MKLFKTFSLYTFVGFLNAGLGFLLLPVLTSYLSPEDYGIISLVNVYVSVFMPIVGLSTAGYAGVEYYNKDISKEEFRHLFSSVRVIPMIGIVVLALLFLAGSSFLPGIMELPLQAYWLVIPLTFFSLFHSNFSTFLITTKRASLFSITTVGKVILEIGLTLLLVVGFGLHWDGRIESALVTALVFSLLSIYFYKRWNLISFRISKKYIHQAILFGSPLIMHQIGKFVINQSDRLFLAKMVSLEEMGIYSVGYQVGTVILIVVTAFSNFFSPFLYERLSRGQEKDKLEVVKVSYIFIGGVFALVVILSLLTPTLFSYFINPRFEKGTQYVFWVGLGYFFWGFYAIFSGYLFYLRKTKILGYIAIVNVVLNMLFNWFFITWFGAIGAAYATCLSYFIVALIIGLVVNKIYPMPWLAFLRRKP